MKLEEIEDEVAKEMKFNSMAELLNDGSYFTQSRAVSEIAKRYATACVNASLKRAHENADFREELIPPNNDREYIFFGIDDPDNIVLL